MRDWDVVYDDRGHFMEPHTKRVIGLGTLNVRDYLSRIMQLKLEEADFDPASVKTYGPNGSLRRGALRRERRLHAAVRAGQAGEALRHRHHVVEGNVGHRGAQARRRHLLRHDIPLLVLHDFDSAGIIIKDTLENDTRRYQLHEHAQRHRPRAELRATSTACRRSQQFQHQRRAPRAGRSRATPRSTS